MKLKFKADGKDWVIFGLFCVILLYFIAIAVLNLSYFANYSRLWGLNPLPAFGKDYLAVTLVGFGVVLVVVMMSVSSIFFERDKGIGISTEAKKEKGYAQWATEKEFKKLLTPVYPGAEKSDVAGIPLINNGKVVWVDAGQYHNLIIGSTGSGKTQIIVQPMVKMLAKKGESMIITDPKGEIYEANAVELREKGYNVVLLNFRNPQQGNSWNPFSLPYELYKNGNKDKANELLDDLAANILYEEQSQSDPFWEKTSADYFTGLSLGLFEDAEEEEINLNSINIMSTVGEDKAGASTYIKEYYSFKEPSSPAYINVSSTIMAPNDTKSSILSVFKQKIKIFSSTENLSEMLGHNDFLMNDIGRKKTAVFIVIHDEKKTYHSLATIFLKQCYEALIDVAQENGGKLPYKTNFILDEFANMPPLKDVTTMVTAARSRSIRFTFIIQNFAQLYKVYGKDDGETIKGNCGNIIYLISSELAALEEISKMCGEVKSKENDKTVSTPLVTVSDLQRLEEGHIIVLRTRSMPFKTRMKYNWQMEKVHAWGKNYEKSGYPQREKQAVKLFDIKKFVDAKKEEKIKELMGNKAGSVPRKTTSAPPGGIDINTFFKNVDQKLAAMEKEEPKSAQPSKQELSKEDKDSIKSVIDSAIKSQVSSIPKETKPSINDEVKSAVDEGKKKQEELIKAEELKKKEQQEKAEAQERIAEEERKQVELQNNKLEELKQLEEKRKAQEKELQEVIKKQENVEEKKIEPRKEITEDQFFDDFFNDEDE